MSKIFKDGLKTSPNYNSVGVSAEFSKFLGEWRRRGKPLTLRFGDVIICFVIPKKVSQTSSLSVTNRPLRNTWLFLFNKLNVVLETQRSMQQ